jgi:hypothetical protein
MNKNTNGVQLNMLNTDFSRRTPTTLKGEIIARQQGPKGSTEYTVEIAQLDA